MQNPVLVLLVGCQEADARFLKSLLPQTGNLYRLECLASVDITTVALNYEIFIVDSQTLVEEIASKVAPAPVILLADEAELGVAALEAGAADYLVKSQLSAPLLEKSLRLTLSASRVKRQRIDLATGATGSNGFALQIEAAIRQLAVLQNSSAAPSASTKNLLSKAIEQLGCAIEELQMQNRELLTLHQVAEKKHQHYQELFDFAPDGYLVTDNQGIILEANYATAALLNIHQKSLLGKPLLIYIASTDRDRLFPLQLEQLEQCQEQELHLQPRNGQSFPVAVTVSAVDDAYQGLAGWRWLIRDITERKQAEATLSQQKELLQTIFDHIPVMIAFFSASGRVELINRELEKVLGWSLTQWQQRNLLEECYPDPQYRQQVIDHMQAATLEQKDLKTRVRDGRVIDTSWANVRLSDGTFIGIGQDISDRKRVEDQLRARLALETALAKTAKLLATNEAADLNSVLKLLSDAVETNRAFLLQFRQGTEADVTHEWYDSESQSIAEQFQNLDMSQFPWWLEQLERNQNIAITDVETMPEAAQREQTILRSINVCALIAVPIFDSSGRLWGSIGFHVTRKNNRQWSAENAQLLRAAGDTIYSYCLRIQAQAHLRASEALYAGIFNHSAEMMLLLRVLPKNNFAYETVNPAYTRLTGITHDHVVGKTLTQLWPPEIAAYFTSRCQECLAAGQPISFEEVFKLPRGSRICHTTLVPIQDTTGQIVRILGSARDITEEKQAIAEQIRLTQYQRLLASLVLKIRQTWSVAEILQTAVTEIQKTLQVERVVFFRLLSNEAGEVISEAVVPPFKAMKGQVYIDKYCLEPVKQKYQQGKFPVCDDVLKSDIDPCYLDFLQQYQIRAYLAIPILLKPARVEPIPNLSSDEQVVWGLICVHQCSKPRAWTAEEIDLLMQLSMQISMALEQAQLREQETRQRQELARSNAELADFAYVASHDLQAPLQTIANYAKLLERRYQNQLDDKAKRYIHYIVSGAQRLQTQIKDLLQYARVNSHIKPLTPTNLNDVLEQALANLSLVIEHNQAAVSVSTLPTLMADGSQLVQLFQNLIGNAIKYRSQDPPVVCIEAKRQEKSWVISVSDNGIGIDPKYFNRIFQVFQRLHTQEEYPGNGIGLSICKKIVERHNGRIWINSSLDNGSQFFIALPDQ